MEEQLNIKLEQMLPEKERRRDLACDALRKEEVVMKNGNSIILMESTGASHAPSDPDGGTLINRSKETQFPVASLQYGFS
jgi:hypothetical protein